MVEASHKRPKTPLSGGFWRRFFSVLIDWLLILSVYQAAGIYLYQSTGGHLRMADSPINFSSCYRQEGLVGRNETTTHIKADYTNTCTHYFFGFEYNQTKQITHVIKDVTNKDGVRTTQTEWESYYVDKKGNRVEPFLIDGLKSLTLLVVLALFEIGLATTPGKMIMGLKLETRDGLKPAPLAVLLRNLMIYGAWCISGILSIATPLLSYAGYQVDPMVNLISAAIMILGMSLPTLSFLFLRPDPFYDDLTKMRVVRKQTARRP